MSEEMSETNIEIRKENKQNQEKLDKILFLMESKSSKKLKSMQLKKQFNQTLKDHTGESAMEAEDDDY